MRQPRASVSSRSAAASPATFRSAWCRCCEQDLQRADVPLWGYFCQISDSTTSYGSLLRRGAERENHLGQAGASTRPSIIIESDATIVAPLMFCAILDDGAVSERIDERRQSDGAAQPPMDRAPMRRRTLPHATPGATVIFPSTTAGHVQVQGLTTSDPRSMCATVVDEICAGATFDFPVLIRFQDILHGPCRAS